MALDATAVRCNEISKQDIIIALMGPTGTGKSNFIDVVTKSPSDKLRAGSYLGSCTQKIQSVRLRNHEFYGSKLVLVDTPGFDDDKRSDMEILELIGDWLKKTYKADIKLAGIIYMHRITDNRMAGDPYRNLRIFGGLCGDKGIEKVMLVTTMWDRVNWEIGQRREDELVTRFWAKVMEHGASRERFDNSESSAWRIIQYFVLREASRQVLLLQEELVDLKKHITETTAGMSLYRELLELLEKQKQHFSELEFQAQQNPSLAAAVEAEKVQTQAKIESIFKQLNSLKVSFSKKVKLFFKRRAKGQGNTVPKVTDQTKIFWTLEHSDVADGWEEMEEEEDERRRLEEQQRAEEKCKAAEQPKLKEKQRREEEEPERRQAGQRSEGEQRVEVQMEEKRRWEELQEKRRVETERKLEEEVHRRAGQQRLDEEEKVWRREQEEKEERRRLEEQQREEKTRKETEQRESEEKQRREEEHKRAELRSLEEKRRHEEEEYERAMREKEKRIWAEYRRLEKERIREEQCQLLEELESMRAERSGRNVQLRSSPEPRDRFEGRPVNMLQGLTSLTINGQANLTMNVNSQPDEGS